MRMLIGWACYRIVMALPLLRCRGIYGWMVAQAGYYAYAPDRAGE